MFSGDVFQLMPEIPPGGAAVPVLLFFTFLFNSILLLCETTIYMDPECKKQT